jgi:hypothetical protein
MTGNMAISRPQKVIAFGDAGDVTIKQCFITQKTF